MYLKIEPIKVSDGLDEGLRERRVKDDPKIFGLSNRRDEVSISFKTSRFGVSEGVGWENSEIPFLFA